MGKKKKTRDHLQPNNDDLNFCELCERKEVLLTGHHLIPVSKGGKDGPQAQLCQPCHSQVHALYTNEELAVSYNTVKLLKSSEQMRCFFKFIKKINAITNIKVKKSRNKKRN